MLNPFKKKWEVYGYTGAVANSKGEVYGRFRRYQNAISFAKEMNAFSSDFFEGRHFMVRRIHGA